MNILEAIAVMYITAKIQKKKHQIHMIQTQLLSEGTGLSQKQAYRQLKDMKALWQQKR